MFSQQHETGLSGSGGTSSTTFTEMCSGSEAGSYLRLIDFVYHSTLGLRVIKKKNLVGDVLVEGLHFGARGLALHERV